MIKELLQTIFNYISENWLYISWKIFLTLITFLLIRILIKWITQKIKDRIEKNSTQSDEKYTKKISNLIWNMIFILLMIFNVLIIFGIMWFDVSILMWWLSLGIWFAMETTIGNMVSGVMILTNKKVKLWDFVEMTWSLKIVGTIDEINIRYTVVKTIDKRRVIVPNMKLAATPIKTLKSEPLIRWEIEFILPRHIDINQIKDLLTKTINWEDKILYKEYTNIFVQWRDYRWIKFKWFFFYDPQWWRTKFAIVSTLRTKLHKIFKEYWISIPYQNITITTE